MRKNCSISDRAELLKFEAEGQELEITRTIYSNSENRILSSDLICTLEKLEFKLEKIIRIQKPTGKVRKSRLLLATINNH